MSILPFPPLARLVVVIAATATDRQLYCHLATETGVKVTPVAFPTYDEAIQWVDDRTINLVIWDSHRIDDVDAVAHLCSEGPFESVPVVLISAQADARFAGTFEKLDVLGCVAGFKRLLTRPRVIASVGASRKRPDCGADPAHA